MFSTIRNLFSTVNNRLNFLYLKQCASYLYNDGYGNDVYRIFEEGDDFGEFRFVTTVSINPTPKNESYLISYFKSPDHLENGDPFHDEFYEAHNVPPLYLIF